MTESSVERIFSRYSNCRPARPQDESELLQFINSQPMKTKNWSLSFQRGEKYFSFYRLSGGSFFPFVMTDSMGKVCGSSGLIRFSTSINKSQKYLGYFCDLRVNPKAPAKVKMEWRSAYLDLINELPTSQNPAEKCDYFVTSVFDTNTPALQALTKKLRGIRYLPLQKYVARSLVFHPWPQFYRHLDSHLKVKTNRAIDKSYIQNWMLMNEGTLGLPYLPDDNSVNQYIEHIQDHWFSNSPFLGIEVTDSGGQLLGACWPWLGSSVRAPVVYGLATKYRWLGKWIRHLGPPPIINGQPMGQIYLSHLMIQPGLPKEQKHKVLRRLVLETYQLAVLHKIHLVTWIEGGWPAAPHVHLADGLIFNMPATMYQVVHDAWGNHPDSFLPNDRPLYLEGASL